MEGTSDVVLLQTDFGLVDGERRYGAMVAPAQRCVFCLIVLLCFVFNLSHLLYPPYPISMQQKRKRKAGGSGLQHGPGGASSAP